MFAGPVEAVIFLCCVVLTLAQARSVQSVTRHLAVLGLEKLGLRRQRQRKPEPEQEHDGQALMPSSEYSASLADAKLMSYARAWLIASGCVLDVGTACRIVAMVAMKDRWIADSADALFTVFFGLVTAANTWPEKLRIDNAFQWYSAIMLVTVACLLPGFLGAEDVNLLRTLLMLPRVLSGLLTSNVGLLAFWNVLFLAAFGLCLVLRAEADDEIDFSLAEFCVLNACEALSTLCLSILVLELRATMVAGTRHEEEAKRALRELAATIRLLETTCDVVVELDQDLCFVRHPPNLALLRGYGEREQQLSGRFFEELLTSEREVDRFVRFMEREEESTTGLGESLNVQMSGGSPAVPPVEVQLFHVRFSTWRDEVHHLLALKEITQAAGSWKHEAESSLGNTDLTFADISGPNGHVLVIPDGEAGEAVITFEACSLELLGASMSFVRQMGPCQAGCRFTDWLVHGDTQVDSTNRRFLCAYGDFVNEFEHSLIDNLDHREDLEQTVTPVGDVRAHRNFGKVQLGSHNAASRWEVYCSLFLTTAGRSPEALAAAASATVVSTSRDAIVAEVVLSEWPPPPGPARPPPVALRPPAQLGAVAQQPTTVEAVVPAPGVAAPPTPTSATPPAAPAPALPYAPSVTPPTMSAAISVFVEDRGETMPPKAAMPPTAGGGIPSDLLGIRMAVEVGAGSSAEGGAASPAEVGGSARRIEL